MENLHKLELDIHEKTYKQTKQKLDYNVSALSKLKHVIKVPRLCKIFQDETNKMALNTEKDMH